MEHWRVTEADVARAREYLESEIAKRIPKGTDASSDWYIIYWAHRVVQMTNAENEALLRVLEEHKIPRAEVTKKLTGVLDELHSV